LSLSNRLKALTSVIFLYMSVSPSDARMASLDMASSTHCVTAAAIASRAERAMCRATMRSRFRDSPSSVSHGMSVREGERERTCARAQRESG
jgi:hypothetical protein